MDAAQLYSSTLEQLNALILKMLSPEWDAKTQAAPPEQRQQALAELLRVERARLVLGNVALQDIAEKLKANEQALLNGQKAVKAVLDKLTTIESALKAVGSLINIVAKIVPLL